jgi:hypothetical protein
MSRNTARSIRQKLAPLNSKENFAVWHLLGFSSYRHRPVTLCKLIVDVRRMQHPEKYRYPR